MSGQTPPPIALLLVCAALCACQTTGDPTQGGLFGWSEQKARQRQADREQTLSQEQQSVQTGQLGAARLQREVRLNAADLAGQQREISQLLANARALEQESPTPATASRARLLRHEIDAVRNVDTLTVEHRWSLLRQYSAEVDLMRAQVAAPDRDSARPPD